MADSSTLIKTLVVKAEDSRLLGDILLQLFVYFLSLLLLKRTRSSIKTLTALLERFFLYLSFYLIEFDAI
jgi:hypothetical protein